MSYPARAEGLGKYIYWRIFTLISSLNIIAIYVILMILLFRFHHKTLTEKFSNN